MSDLNYEDNVMLSRIINKCDGKLVNNEYCDANIELNYNYYKDKSCSLAKYY